MAVIGLAGDGGASWQRWRALAATASTQRHRAELDGEAMDVEIVMPGRSVMRVSLKGALISSYSTSGGDDRAIESWTLNASSMTYSVEGEADASDGVGPSYDLTPARPE